MLTSGAAEIDGQVGESSLEMVSHSLVYHVVNIIAERFHRVVLFEINDYGSIFTSQVCVFGKATRIREYTAVEDEAAAVTGRVPGDAPVV